MYLHFRNYLSFPNSVYIGLIFSGQSHEWAIWVAMIGEPHHSADRLCTAQTQRCYSCQSPCECHPLAPHQPSPFPLFSKRPQSLWVSSKPRGQEDSMTKATLHSFPICSLLFYSFHPSPLSHCHSFLFRWNTRGGGRNAKKAKASFTKIPWLARVLQIYTPKSK